MPWLVLLTSAFAVGILSEHLGGGSVLHWLGGALTALVMACAGIAGTRPLLAGLLFGAASMGAGGLASALQRADVQAHAAWPAMDVVLEGVLARPLYETSEAVHAIVDVDGVVSGETLAGVVARVLVIAPRPMPELLPGDRVRAAGVVLLPRGAGNEGGFDRGRYLYGRGIDGILGARPPGLARVAAPAAFTPWRTAARIQDRAARRLALAAPGDGGAFLSALVVGRRAALRPSIEDAFRNTGTSHVLSVSGLHLFAVAMLLYRGTKWAWLRSGRLALAIPAERVAACVAIPVAVAYTMVTGAEVATVRALVCTLVVLCGAALGRRPDALTALAVAAIAVLAHSPWTLFEPSFQLSFAASLALLTLGRRWGKIAQPGASRTRRALTWVWRLMAASLAASLATAPLTALHFGAVQPAGVLANLLVVPATELLLLPLGLCGLGVAAVWPALGSAWIAQTAWLGGLLIDTVSFLGAHAPVFEVPPPSLPELLACLFALAALGSPLKPRLAAALCALGAATVGLSVYLTTELLPARRANVTVTFLDVGQGDSAVIEAPGGETWLIDAGGRLFGAPPGELPIDQQLLLGRHDPGERDVWTFLRARRIQRLDVVVVSHPHPDHYGGLRAIATHVSIGELWITDQAIADPSWKTLLAELAGRGVRIRRPPLGVARQRGGARLLALAPADDSGTARARPEREVNDNSLVMRLEFAGRSVLFPGDLEAAGEASLLGQAGPVPLKTDVVKAPHHGSRTSSSPAFVRATAPGLVVVSCGVNNRFRFPAGEVVRRWQDEGARVLRTDQTGAVSVTLSTSGALTTRTFLRGEEPAPPATEHFH